MLSRHYLTKFCDPKKLGGGGGRLFGGFVGIYQGGVVGWVFKCLLYQDRPQVNGELTLGENIADNGGMHESFRAYMDSVAELGEEGRLPGLDQYTPEQMFFISYAQASLTLGFWLILRRITASCNLALQFGNPFFFF